MTFLSLSWRSLNHLKGSLNHPKKVTKNCQVTVVFIVSVGGSQEPFNVVKKKDPSGNSEEMVSVPGKRGVRLDVPGRKLGSMVSK